MDNIVGGVKSYLNRKVDELKTDYSYSPLTENDIVELIWKYNIAERIDTTQDEFLKYKDCEFFSSNDMSGRTSSVFDVINSCHSVTGSALLREQCCDVVNNVDDLVGRQGIIRNVSEVYLDVDGLLGDFAKIENGLYWHLKDKSVEFNELCDTLYFKTKMLKAVNEKKWALSAYYFFLIVWSPLWGIFGPVVFFFMPYLFSKYIMKLPIPFSFYWGQLKNMLFGKQLFTIMNVIKSGVKIMRGGGSNGFKDIIIDKVFDVLISPVGKWLYFAIILIGYLWTITNSIVQAWNTNKFTNFIHERMNEIHRLFSIYTSVRRITGLDISDLDDSIKFKHMDNGTHKFINDVLRCEVICGDCGFTKLKGECLQMFWRLKNNNGEEVEIITAVIKYLGVIDKLVNQVKLVYNNGFTFAEYLQDVDLPKLECSGIFNPVLGSKCIKNDIKLYLDSILDTEIDTENDIEDNIEELENIENENDIEANEIDANEKEENEKEENEKEENEIEENEIENNNIEKIENIEQEKNNNEIETNKNYLDTFIEDKFDDIKQNCILTGPNGSGKSSMLKTILLNVILAQTLGIVPATNVKLTPFKYISSYLNIADSQGKESLFQAEMSRCHNHLEKLKSLETEEDGFSFNIMDEIFVSTNYFEGVSGAYAVIKALELYKKSINIVTTHFDALTRKENRGPTYCYKYFTIEDDGSKDYQIRSGINEKHCALTLLEDRGFDEELCNNAKLFYKQIKTKGN